MALQERIRFHQQKEWQIPWRAKTNPTKITLVKAVNAFPIGEHWGPCELCIVVKIL